MEGSVTPILERILADGEWGAVYFRTEGQKGKNGADFSMQYCWLMRVVDGKIVEVKGWYDQKKLWDLFETDVGAKA